MNTKILMSVFFFLGISIPAFGGGLITISGRLNSITPALYVIESEKSIFHLKKGALTKEQTKLLSQLNKQVSLAVPFSAVERIQEK